MWSQQKPNGKYQYFDRYTDPLTGKLRTISVTLPTNKRTDQKVARRLLDERIQAATAFPVRSAPMTMDALTAAYVKSQSATKKASTARTAEYKMVVLCDLLGHDSLVTAFTAPYVRAQLMASRSGEEVTNVTFNERLKYFKALMHWAYEEELVADVSYLEKLKKRPEKKTDENMKYLESDELASLIGGMAVTEWALATRFLALSGLRIGELIALENTDIDYFANVIHVTKTFSLVTWKIDTTKTDTSTRDVYMQNELLDCVHDIMEWKKNTVKKFGNPSPHFLPDLGGGRMHYDAYRKYFRENTLRILGRSLTPHALRHTHVALLAENGIGLDAISRRLGHSDSQITRDIYFHVTERLREKENAAIKNISLLSFCYPEEIKKA